jgi:hypothetical protein
VQFYSRTLAAAVASGLLGLAFVGAGLPGPSSPGSQALLWCGALLVALAVTLPYAAPRLLRRVAFGGRLRCLNCGARRRAGMTFCPECGWRTDGEHAAANPPVDPWEKER